MTENNSKNTLKVKELIQKIRQIARINFEINAINERYVYMRTNQDRKDADNLLDSI